MARTTHVSNGGGGGGGGGGGIPMVPKMFKPLRFDYMKKCVPTEDKDQHVHPCSLIGIFIARSLDSQGSHISSDKQQRP